MRFFFVACSNLDDAHLAKNQSRQQGVPSIGQGSRLLLVFGYLLKQRRGSFMKCLHDGHFRQDSPQAGQDVRSHRWIGPTVRHMRKVINACRLSCRQVDELCVLPR